MSSGSASASVEEFIEILNAEQHVDLQKLRDYARHGVQPGVRGEVWLYLLGVLSDDKSQEMTFVRSKYLEYDSLDKHNPYLEKKIRNESARYYQRNLIARPPPGRALARSSQRLSSRTYGSTRKYSSSGLLIQPHLDRNHVSQSQAKQQIYMNRGPNRVDNGQSRMLAGIMGSSSVSKSASMQSSEDEDLLMDPEAAAGSEMKRFCNAVENIICAHLNRWRVSQDSSNKDIGLLSDTEDSHTKRTPSSLDSSASSSSREDLRYSTLDNEIRESSARSAAASSASSDSDQRSQERLDMKSTEMQAAKKSTALFPNLPREYQWAHQPAEESSTSRLFTLDSVTLRGIDHSGQLIQPDYHPGLILLCSPFVKCIRVEAGMYFAFEKLMSMRDDYYATHPLPWQISTFLTLFRTTLPELHAYFEEEEVDMIGLASAWLRHLLAGEMRIEDLMRLWDTYFAVPDPMDLHMYVCIAILTNCKDALEELDQSEAKSMLFSLPPLDVDRILNEAINIRLSHRQSEALQGGR